MYVYLITNILNGKYYVGQTTRDLDTRWKEHLEFSRYAKKQTHFSQAIRKYGSENFKKDLLCVCPDNKRLNEVEEFFIWILASSKKSFGYNSTKGGDRVNSTPETAKKISRSLLGRKLSQETKDKMRKANLGKKLSEDHKNKIGKANKGKKDCKEVITARGLARKGLPWSQKARLAHEKANKEKKERIINGNLESVRG